MNNEVLKNDFLTVADISQYLNISLSNAYNLIHRKDFPVCRLGGTIRIPRTLFLSWIEQCTYVPSGLNIA